MTVSPNLASVLKILLSCLLSALAVESRSITGGAEALTAVSTYLSTFINDGGPCDADDDGDDFTSDTSAQCHAALVGASYAPDTNPTIGNDPVAFDEVLNKMWIFLSAPVVDTCADHCVDTNSGNTLWLRSGNSLYGVSLSSSQISKHLLDATLVAVCVAVCSDRYPSMAPANPTADPTVGCEDDPTFTFNGKAKKTCAWIGQRKTTKTTTTCNRAVASGASEKVWEKCPVTCGECPGAACADSSSWSSNSVNCSSVASNTSLCSQNDAYLQCKSSCGTCDGVDDTEYKFRGKNRRGCGWVRRKSKCEAMDDGFAAKYRCQQSCTV